MSTAHYTIKPISKRNFGNTFHNQNGPNQCQHFDKPIGQQYQYISFQIPNNSPITYLKEKCFGCGLDSKEVRELLMQHDGKLETRPFKGIVLIKKNTAR